jgi:endo-1,4-beta-xylanase
MSVQQRSVVRGRIGRGVTAMAAAALVLLGAARVAAQGTSPVILNDFEDGTTQSWIPRGGGVVLATTTEAAHGGTQSLKTTGRTAGFHGPSLNLLGRLTRGSTYQITVWVRLVAGQSPDTLKVTMQRTPTGGSNAFDQIAASATNGVTDAAWVMLQGQYSFATDVTGLLLYVEAAGATTAYDIDDFSVLLVSSAGCGAQPDTSGIHSTFEDGTAQHWTPRIGEELLTVTTADQHSGSFSLLTTGRQHAFSGPSLNAAGKLCNGSQYRVSVWARLAPGEASTQLRVSLQRSLAGTTSFNTLVGNTTVTANAWVQLSATVDFAFNYDTLSIYVESASGLASFSIDDFDVTFVPPVQIETDLAPVAETFAGLFPIGAAVSLADLSGPHAQLLARHFNSITSENDMKWDATEPTEGAFTFTNSDPQVAFAKAHAMLVRGHTLLWHSQVPAWVFLDANGNAMTPTPDNKALLLQRLINHIRGVVSHFGGDISAWDVVNEVIDPAQPDGFRRSPWFTITGTDFIDTAFLTARELAPHAKLFINDFNTTQEPKRTFLYNLVRDLQARGIPIDGVGHQMHSNIQFPSPQSVLDTITLFAGLGLENQITELDISIYTNSSDAFTDYASIPQERLVQQAYLYRDFFQAFRQLQTQGQTGQAGPITSVTFWGKADAHTWLTSATRVDAPLLFDLRLQHKLAYLGVVDPLKLPGANLETSISADAGTVTSGHAVAYAIAVMNHGPDAAAAVSLVDTIPAGLTFQSLTAPAGWSCTTPAVGDAGQIACTAASLDANAPAQFTLTLAAACAAPDGATITNRATAGSSSRNPNPTPLTTATANVLIANPPPVMTAPSVDHPFLAPASRQMVTETLTYTATATCGTALVPAIAVTSNQPGAVPPPSPDADWMVLDPHHVLLRAVNDPFRRTGREPAPPPQARIYTITLTATDAAGSTVTNAVQVTVSRPPTGGTP